MSLDVAPARVEAWVGHDGAVVAMDPIMDPARGRSGGPRISRIDDGSTPEPRSTSA